MILNIRNPKKKINKKFLKCGLMKKTYVQFLMKYLGKLGLK